MAWIISPLPRITDPILKVSSKKIIGSTRKIKTIIIFALLIIRYLTTLSLIPLKFYPSFFTFYFIITMIFDVCTFIIDTFVS